MRAEGLPGPARGRVRRSRRLADRIRRLGAADLGHVCDRTGRSHSPACDVRTLRGSARLASGFISGVPGANGYVYGWNDVNFDHVIQENEVNWDDDSRVLRFGLDPQSLPNPPNEVAPDLQTPSTDEVTVGVDRELGENLAVSGTFAYRNTTDLQSLLPIGANASTCELGGRATGTATSSDGFTLAFDEPYVSAHASPPPQPGGLALNRPGASQRYFGVDVSIVKRLSKNWMLRGQRRVEPLPAVSGAGVDPEPEQSLGPMVARTTTGGQRRLYRPRRTSG